MNGNEHTNSSTSKKNTQKVSKIKSHEQKENNHLFPARGYIFLANTGWSADLFQIWISHPCIYPYHLRAADGTEIQTCHLRPYPGFFFDTHHPLPRQNHDDEITVDGSEIPNNHRLDGAKTLINWLAGFLPRSSTPNHCAQSRSKRRWCQDPIVLKSSACLGVLFLFSFAGGENTTWW